MSDEDYGVIVDGTARGGFFDVRAVMTELRPGMAESHRDSLTTAFLDAAGKRIEHLVARREELSTRLDEWLRHRELTTLVAALRPTPDAESKDKGPRTTGEHRRLASAYLESGGAHERDAVARWLDEQESFFALCVLIREIRPDLRAAERGEMALAFEDTGAAISREAVERFLGGQA